MSATPDRASLVCGFAATGLAAGLEGLAGGPLPAGWPAMEIVHSPAASGAPAPADWTIDRAEWAVAGGPRLRVERAESRATILAPAPPTADDLLDPLLPYVGAVLARWTGGDALHAGAVLLGDHAWGVLGASTRGKSTLLAHMAQQRVPVLADDVLVIRGGVALAGPRAIYLRAPAAARLGAGTRARRGDGREKYRFTLSGAPLQAPLAGWVVLRPGERVQVRRLTPPERLDVLVRFRPLAALTPPTAALLELVALPGFELRHPRRWEHLGEVGARLEELGDRYG